MSVGIISAEPSYFPMNPLFMRLSRDDINLPLIYPITGQLPEKSFDSLIQVMCNMVFPYSPYVRNPTYAQILNGFTGDLKLPPIDHIRKKMTKEKLAVIKNKSTGSLKVDLSKRVCQRHTFDHNVVSEISDIIIDFLKQYLIKETNVKINDVKLDPFHGDILYYEEGGVFDLHVDGINKFPFGENELDDFGLPSWRMYTLLIGIDSNLTPISLSNGDGNTVVYLPDQSFLQHICRLGRYKPMDLYELLFELKVYKNRHSFIDSCQKGNFLLFSSEALHASNKIMQKRGFKMAMKLDVWIKINSQYNYKNELSPEILGSLGNLSDGSLPFTLSYMTNQRDEKYLYHNILVNPYKCKCHDCSKYILKMQVYQKNIVRIFKETKLNCNVCIVISEFVFGKSSKDRCLKEPVIMCSCYRCVPYHYINEDEGFYDDYDEDDDEYDCNGYDY